MPKVRLDLLLMEKELAESRSKAQALIMAGQVRVDGEVIIKAGTRVSSEADIVVDTGLPFVSRGGFKLDAALEGFEIKVEGLVCADVGASTGGFTDVLLQAGAARVYAIDVGYGQLAWKIRQADRVVVMERTNARYLESLPEKVNLVTIDVSFISLKLIVPAVVNWLALPAEVVALVKPQFEAGRSQVGKGGVIRDRAVHREVLQEIVTFAKTTGFELLGLMVSPITGPAGNHEFLLYLGWGTNQPSRQSDAAIASCLAALPRESDTGD
jgi:23S rRNA (cytidine1920-2'-O)/16S rRNA (cytidine1409-2'-O)-methyltransferase